MRLFALLFLYPFAWLLAASLKPRGEVFDNALIPKTFLPGNYEMPAVATLFNALYLFGGPSDAGSLRRIELRRTDGTRRVFDLYQFLVFGDAGQDVLVTTVSLPRAKLPERTYYSWAGRDWSLVDVNSWRGDLKQMLPDGVSTRLAAGALPHRLISSPLSRVRPAHSMSWRGIPVRWHSRSRRVTSRSASSSDSRKASRWSRTLWSISGRVSLLLRISNTRCRNRCEVSGRVRGRRNALAAGRGVHRLAARPSAPLHGARVTRRRTAGVPGTRPHQRP